jgi:hypothetical protein
MNTDYIILNPVFPNSGLFAFIWQSIRGIYHNPNEKYYFKFGPECCYYDHSILGMNNAWEYYFEQPHINYQPFNVKKVVGIIDVIESEFREGEEFGLSREEYNNRRFVFNEIIQKYIKLKPHIQNKIDEFCQMHFKNKRVIGIHCRGTDHPNNTDITKFLDKIKQLSAGYDLIFAMSDEQSKIDVLQEAFQDRLVTCNTYRSPSNMPLHISMRNMHNPRLIGEEVLIEAYVLARTDRILLYTGSNVNFYVRALNPTLQYESLI